MSIKSGHEEAEGELVVEVADEMLSFRSIQVNNPNPKGSEIAEAVGFKSLENVVVLQLQADGTLAAIEHHEVLEVKPGVARFVIVESDRVYFLLIDGRRHQWPCRIVSGAVLRKLAAVLDHQALFVKREDGTKQEIGDHDLVDLDGEGIESFFTRAKVWTLNVHGVVIDVLSPTIVVGVALEQAGFDINKPWNIYLQVVGKKKEKVDLRDIINLESSDIEKLRVMPDNINNGEVDSACRRDFALLNVDVIYLGRLQLKWETIIEGKRRWLLIHNYPVPVGFTLTATNLVLDIPFSYPGAEIDSFYVYPPLKLKSGRSIPRTHLRASLMGLEFHGWSRHRTSANPWDQTIDNVVTHIGLVEASLSKEVE